MSADDAGLLAVDALESEFRDRLVRGGRRAGAGVGRAGALVFGHTILLASPLGLQLRNCHDQLRAAQKSTT